MKRSSIVCLYCPQDFITNVSQFSDHCESVHSATIRELSCVWCGQLFTLAEQLRQHNYKCSMKNSPLSENNWTLCGFCPTIFFFADLTKSPFFIAHMNNHHRIKIDELSWGTPCHRCKSLFPTFEAAQAHGQLCYQSAPMIKLKFGLQPAADQIPAVPKINHSVLSKQASRSRASVIPALPQSLEKVTYQLCGLCSKTISGM